LHGLEQQQRQRNTHVRRGRQPRARHLVGSIPGRNRRIGLLFHPPKSSCPHPTHPPTPQILWAFCVYLEAVSVLPQLRMMQKAKVVEKFTAHYVFALGLSRFISCAHWILQVGAPGSSTARSGGSIPGSLRRQSLRCSGDR
jgi:hypothetical protein